MPFRPRLGLAKDEFFHSGLFLPIHENRMPGTICLPAPRVKPEVIKIASTIFDAGSSRLGLLLARLARCGPQLRLPSRSAPF